MSKYLSPAAIITMVVWVAFWSWYLSGEYLGCYNRALQQAPVFQIQHGQFRYSGQEVLSFRPSTAIPQLNPEHHQLLGSIGRYLRTHPGLFLHLKGLCAGFEKNATSYEDLGLARAEAVKGLLLAAGAPPRRIFTEAERVDNLISVEGRLHGAVQFYFSEEGRQKPVSLKSFIASQAEKVFTLHFPEGRYELQETLEKAPPLLDSLIVLVDREEGYRLLVTGFSNSIEEQKSLYNLAELRARAVRQYLLTHGLDRRKVDMRFVLHESPSDDFSKVELKIKG